MTGPITSETGSESVPFQVFDEGRDEFNLIEFPLTTLGDRPPRGTHTLRWEDEIVDKTTHKPVRRQVTVSASEATGLPTALDSDILFAFLQLTKWETNFSSRDLAFSRYQLIRILGWGDEGKSYKRLQASLDRWAALTIWYSSWRDKSTETWRSETFHILDNVDLRHRERTRTPVGDVPPSRGTSTLTWNRVIVESVRAGYVCPIDVRLYFQLQSAVARRMLRYLSKHFRLRQQPEMTFDLKTFAFEKIGISRSAQDAGQIKRELRHGIEELERAGFLRKSTDADRYRRLGPGQWKIRLARQAPARDAAPERTPAPLPASPLVRSLVERGVAPAVAASLATDTPGPDIEAKLDVFDWLVGRNDRRVSKNPAGFLAESIRRGYSPPPGYESPADREARRQKALSQQAIQMSREQQQGERQRQAEQELRSGREAYVQSLAPEDRARFVEEAFRLANRFFLQQYHKHVGTGVELAYRDAILDDHHARIVKDRSGR